MWEACATTGPAEVHTEQGSKNGREKKREGEIKRARGKIKREGLAAGRRLRQQRCARRTFAAALVAAVEPIRPKDVKIRQNQDWNTRQT